MNYSFWKMIYLRKSGLRVIKTEKQELKEKKELLERLEKDKEKYTPEIAKDYNGEKTIDEFRNSPLFVN